MNFQKYTRLFVIHRVGNQCRNVFDVSFLFSSNGNNDILSNGLEPEVVKVLVDEATVVNIILC